MERMMDPGKFSMAYALVSCDESSLSLIDCNNRFRALSGLECEEGRNIAEKAFGDKWELSLEKILTRETMILNFASTGRSFRAGCNRKGKGLYELMGIDFTEYERKEEYMLFRASGYRQFIDNLRGIAFQRMLKPERLAMFTSGALERLTGYTEDQSRDLASWLEIIHPDDRDRMAEEGLRIYEKPGYENESEYRIIRKDGEVRWVRSYDNHFRSDDGLFEMVQGLIVDVTEQKNQEQKIREQNILLEELSITDHMTGLSNRRFMVNILDHFISDYKRSEVTFSLLMIDLDHFKLVNDRYGHDAGDEVIKKMADVLRSDLRETDLKARWGGEEFLVLLPRTNREEALLIAGKLLKIVRSLTVTHNNIDMKFTFSCGIAVNDRRLSAEILLKHADKALYRAKEEGRDRVFLWDDK
ncbi:MAG: diguanylate cyclase [Spirochaetales bacterium]|nr:diguanylate cyclase [Spirochaetales bacterium]